MELQIIEKINEAKRMIEKYECNLIKYRKKSKKTWKEINQTGIRDKICGECVLGQANVDIYDIHDNDVEINICTLLDVVDYIKP